MLVKAERLLIRKFEFKDWQAVHEYTSDINVMEYIPEGVFTKEDTRNFVNENIGKNAKNFPVVLIDEDILIGHIVFLELPPLRLEVGVVQFYLNNFTFR
ncbi:GNAT family N-acetyltransferase [Bacillus cereus group sp. BfR-BA-01309]|uniref:GNAT family N-acetyltransferase n=1 Tax=Bacillus cereus group sp. BfR-BA-01309 TaxID=2920286 RepID=UPI002815E0C8|nr:GNAT family N-acetyltransferase [Bacillus cereus group sp. BfR-BA-01309]